MEADTMGGLAWKSIQLNVTGMRYVTFHHNGVTQAGVMVDGGIASVGYPDVGALLRDGARGSTAAAESISRGPDYALPDVELRRPVLAPTAVVCVGLNYRTHILEMGRPLPETPTLFSKLPLALTDPFAEIRLPAASASVDYEGELAVVIGRGGRDIRPEEAWSAIAGLTVLNDVSMRDFQRRSIQWFAGKSWEASTPWGHQVVSLDELGDLDSLELRVDVNGEERQRALLGDLVFDIPALVSDISSIFTLRPGDVIATGTPGGVGEAREPTAFLEHGDVVEVTVAGVGTVRNRFVST
jgi:acylpyruvate hydrolase